MKSILSLLIPTILLVFTSYGQQEISKQYFLDSPEIIICHKVVKAFETQDWKTYRSFFNDTSKLWYNVNFLTTPGENIDSYIAKSKENIASMFESRIDDDIWEMIVDNDGNKWVYLWGIWVVKLTEESAEIEIPFHIAYHLVDGKIVEEAGFWDNLPLYLAKQKLKE